MGSGIRFFFHVMGDLVEASTWRIIRVAVFVVRFGVLFYLSVAFIRFVVHMHA